MKEQISIDLARILQPNYRTAKGDGTVESMLHWVINAT